MSEKKLIQCLQETFAKPWGVGHLQSYRILSGFLNSVSDEITQQKSRENLSIIRNNLASAKWFQYSKSKPILNQLLDQIKITTVNFISTSNQTNLELTLQFEKFIFHVDFQTHSETSMTNLIIHFTSKPAIGSISTSTRAYLALSTSTVNPQLKIKPQSLSVPEFSQIYDICGLSTQMLSQSDFLMLWIEILSYFDSSEMLIQIPLSSQVQVSLKDLASRVNTYINDKSDYGYKLIK
jgi:hypothetical protein